MPPSPLGTNDPGDCRRYPATTTSTIVSPSNGNRKLCSSLQQKSDDASAMSVASSTNYNDLVLKSWHCPHCQFENSDPAKETCALCGIHDPHHSQEYRTALKRQRDTESYRWYPNSQVSRGSSSVSVTTTSNSPVMLRNISHCDDDRPPLEIVKAKTTKSSLPTATTTEAPYSNNNNNNTTTPETTTKPGFGKYPLPLTLSETALTSPPTRKSTTPPVAMTRRIPTPYVGKNHHQQQQQLLQRTKATRPGRHGSFDYGEDDNNKNDIINKCHRPPEPVPMRRPPKSPITNKAASSSDTMQSPPLAVEKVKEEEPPHVVEFSHGKIQADREKEQQQQRGCRRTRQASFSSSTAAVKSGLGGDCFFVAEDDAQLQPLGSSFSTLGEDNSVSRASYSSRSTVKVSNTTTTTTTTSCTNKVESHFSKPSLAVTLPSPRKGQDQDVVSLMPPRRSKSSPMAGKKALSNERILGTPPSMPRRYRSGCSTGTPVEVIHEDVEQSSTPFQDPPRMTATTPTTKATEAFVPPVQFYFSGSAEESLPPPDSREIAITSLEHATKVPSMSSFGSSTASTRYMAFLEGEENFDNSAHGSTNDMTSNNDTEQQSNFVDEKGGSSSGENQQLRHQERFIPSLWLVVVVSLVGLMIILLSVFLSSNSSSTKFEVGLTSSPTMPPRTKVPTSPRPTVSLRTSVPSSSPTYDAMIGEAVDAEIIVTGDDYSNDEVEEQPGGHGALYKVNRVSTESGAEKEHLGLMVAVGGNGRVVMLGEGFIRVVEWCPASPSGLTWPLKSSSLTETGFGENKPVGRDIHFDANPGGETPSLAMSGDGQRIAMVIDASLFVWEHDALDEQWQLIFLDSILQDGFVATEEYIVPTGVSMSYDGRTIVAGTVALTKNGQALVVRVWNVEDVWNEKNGAQFVKMLEDYRPSESGPLNLKLSHTGSVLAVCLNETVLVKAMGDVVYDKSMSLDLDTDDGSEPIPRIEVFAVSACGLSGDGRAIAVSSQNKDETFVYSLRNSSWILDSVLQTTGSSVSLDESGRFVATGGSPGGVVSLWGQNQIGSDYHLVHQVRSIGGLETKSSKSVALSQESEALGECLMAVGSPDGDGRVDLYQINELILL